MFFQVKNILGNPAYENENVIIYGMDCLEGMRRIPSEIIDLSVTSPPYNIGKEYEDILSVDEYILWCSEWMSELHRLSKKDGSLWLNVGYLEVENKGLAVPIPYLLWDKTEFYLIQEIVWNYSAGVACKKRLSPRNEKILWYVKNPENYKFNLDEIRDPNVKYPNQKKNGKLKCNPLGKNPSDVWQIPKVTSGKNRSSKERMDHPAQFPLEMIDRIIKAGSNPGDTIIDPFMGSGTTAISALKNGRKVIGFEKNSDYINIIANRIDDYYLNESQNLLLEESF
ncbi:DNA-methyltransferase [Proteus mirabilis]|uniref:DNA-methyltransferase n=2 Tax=Proteus mirabilis TaxID=584 RepID=UPI00218223FE|nr:site-specific DNA-methyltransferase [Proteus mirabilis]MCT0104231.1 site-specific DNA-methyltransferase [Proteus mirabilis]